jgi:endonuclease/exonuclease/phosphatase family metal-dependent hydrolase
MTTFRHFWVFWRRIGHLGRGVLLYGVFLLFLAINMHVIAEKYPLTTLIAYIPQWPFLVPVGVYLCIALFKKRRKVLFFAIGMVFFWLLTLSDMPLGGMVPKAKPPHALRVMTWNIHHDTAAIPQFVTTIRQEKPDIICLQEANSVYAYPQIWQLLQKELAASGLQYQCIAAGDLAIAVKITPETAKPITSWKYRPLKVAGWRNHLLEAVVTIDGKPLTVFTAHFDHFARPQSLTALSRGHLSPLVEENQSRQQQTKDTLAWIAGRTTPDFIFTGDLNTPPHGNIYQQIATVASDAYAGSPRPSLATPTRQTFPRCALIISSAAAPYAHNPLTSPARRQATTALWLPRLGFRFPAVSDRFKPVGNKIGYN